MSLYNNHLVIGNTGKTGSRVFQGLLNLGHKPRAGSRHSELPFDWDDETTWAPALNGIDAVYLTYYPDLALPKAPGDISKFCALAKLKGIQHITLLSGRAEPAAQICEDIVKQSDLSWTVIRASWFNQNFSEGLFKNFIQAGKIALPVGPVREPFIDVNDIAEIAISSLRDSRHRGRLYEVTGPELLNFSEVADRFSKILNRKISFEMIDIDTFRSNLAHLQVDEGTTETLIYLFTEVLDGRSESLADGVQRALGRPAKSFDRFILETRASYKEIA